MYGRFTQLFTWQELHDLYNGLPLTFAGLWECWGPDKLLSCTILTTDAWDGIRPADGFEPWLAGEAPSVDPGIDEALEAVPVSPKMNSPQYNEPDCLEAFVLPGQ